MPTRFVTITGVMTWNEDPTEPPKPPLGIWGPSDPRPTLPIAGWDPGSGAFPPWSPPVQRPPWAPEVPGSPGWGRPHPDHPISGIPGISLPIQLPGMPGWPEPPKPPTGGQVPGMPGQLPGSDPGGSGWVFAFVPGYGWMWAYVPKKPEEPPVEPPVEPPAVP